MNNKVRSPCIANCKLDEDEVCQGCFRTLDEILIWSSSSDQEKMAIIDRVTPIKAQKKAPKKPPGS